MKKSRPTLQKPAKAGLKTRTRVRAGGLTP